ncbi:hypothetical protein LCGC14_0969280 [marine sediment metagenome]|uniref:UDP-N-acetylglucosamine 2-epimerase domain-containing protein n=1 Tax=marine sediment metagenome TaxID=412755 RepID=A0A0F9QVA9_9ZZZZ
MKALFLIDNVPAIEMFIPIIMKLGGESVFVNYSRNKQNTFKIEEYMKNLAVRCEIIKRHNKRCVNALLAQEKPGIVILAREETMPIEKYFTSLCREKKIRTLLVPHGMLMSNELQLWGLSGKLFRLKHIYRLFKQGVRKLLNGKITLNHLIQAGIFRVRNDYKDKVTLSRYDTYDKIATYGEAMKKILLKYNVKPENIVLTGNPKYDAQTRNNGHKKHNAILIITNYLVEFGTWNKWQRENYILDIHTVANALSQNLLVKIHPVMEDANDYIRIAHNNKMSLVLYQSEPLAEVINKCDIGITTMSSGGLEVLATGKPLIVYNPYNDITQYNDKSGVYFARNTDELLVVLNELIKNGMSDDKKKLSEEFVYQQAYLQDGKASERISELILDMAGGKNG